MGKLKVKLYRKPKVTSTPRSESRSLGQNPDEPIDFTGTQFELQLPLRRILKSLRFLVTDYTRHVILSLINRGVGLGGHFTSHMVQYK